MIGARIRSARSPLRTDRPSRYDKLVSIEMIEAVGWRHLGSFFAKCSELLEADGAMLVQAITIDDRAYEAEKASRSFINQRIFPGGSLPSLEVIVRRMARRTDLQTLHLEDLTSHYVRTLRCWREAFTANKDALEQLGYEKRFRRLWTLYLAYCQAGFAERRIGATQILCAEPDWRNRSPTAGAPVIHIVPAPVSTEGPDCQSTPLSMAGGVSE